MKSRRRTDRQDDVERNGRTASAPTLVEHVSDRVGGECAALMGLVERSVELCRAVLIEEAEQTTGGPAEMSAVQRDAS